LPRQRGTMPGPPVASSDVPRDTGSDRMKPGIALNDAYGELIALARSLSAGGHYEATYHALMSALHCAEETGDSARLAEIGKLFSDHKKVVDALEPPHKLSTKSSHGARSVFEMAVCMTEAVMKRLENQHRIEEMRESHKEAARASAAGQGRTRR